MKPLSGRGSRTVRWVRVMVVGLVAVLGVGAGRVRAEPPVTVVIAEADLDWPVSDYGHMGWSGFGQKVSEASLCSNVGLGGPVGALRFELTFDLSTDPATLTGNLSGAMQDATEEEWAEGSFSGPITDGWARETEEGWAWGGTADLTLDFAGARTCATISDDSGAVVDRIVAEGSGQRQLTAEFAGGSGAFGEGTSGFRLDGSGGSLDYVSGQVGDGWSISLGCTGCDLPVSLPVGSGGAPSGEAGGPPSGSRSVFGVPSWLSGVVGGPPVDAGGQSAAQSDQGDTGGEGRWDPVGIGILVLFLVLIALATLVVAGLGRRVRSAVAQALVGVAGFESESGPGAGPTATLARDVQAQISHRELPTVMVEGEGPVRPRTSPDPGAPHAGLVLQPGQPYTLTGSAGEGPDGWVQVRQGSSTGWVHRGTVRDWQPGEIVMPARPSPGVLRETVGFPRDFDARVPGGEDYTRLPAGSYDLDPPGPDGFRPVYDWQGKLVGSIPADQAPPSTLTKGTTPPPPP